MKSAQLLREKLRKGDLTIGMIITTSLSLEMLEIATAAGMDYVIVDMEHVTHSDTLVADACRVGRMCNFPVLVRPPRTDAESIRLAMDLGPCGLLCPMVESVEQLNTIRDGAWMPPRGQRRPGGPGNWWVQDFNYETWKREVEQDFIILAQIESPKGLENIRAIAQHEIVTAMAVGPYDMSARLGVCWHPDNPKLKNALQTIRDAAKSAGKPMWMIGDGEKLSKQGCHFLCIAEPMNLLRAVLKRNVEAIREGAPQGGTVKAFVP